MAWCKECQKSIPESSIFFRTEGGETFRITTGMCDEHGEIEVKKEKVKRQSNVSVSNKKYDTE